MGYLVIIITVILFIWFVWQKWRHRSFVAQQQAYQGYYLLVRKYEEAGRYYGVFQQGDQEVLLEMSPDLYIRIPVLLRGFLKATDKKVVEFS